MGEGHEVAGFRGKLEFEGGVRRRQSGICWLIKRDELRGYMTFADYFGWNFLAGAGASWRR